MIQQIKKKDLQLWNVAMLYIRGTHEGSKFIAETWSDV